MSRNLAATLLTEGRLGRLRSAIMPFLRSFPFPGSWTGYRRFIILSPGRTGSQMMVQRCNSHPAVSCYHELLNPSVYDFTDPGRQVLWQAWNHHSRAIDAVGFKVLYAQHFKFRKALIPLLTGAKPVQIIHLTRRDQLARYLSLLHAHETGVYHLSGQRSRPLQLRTRRVDLDHFRRFLQWHDLTMAVALRDLADCPVLNLVYEDVIADFAAADRAICEVLGVPVRPLMHGTQPTGTIPPQALIENYVEVCALLSDSTQAGARG